MISEIWRFGHSTSIFKPSSQIDSFTSSVCICPVIAYPLLQLLCLKNEAAASVLTRFLTNVKHKTMWLVFMKGFHQIFIHVSPVQNHKYRLPEIIEVGGFFAEVCRSVVRIVCHAIGGLTGELPIRSSIRVVWCS